MSAILDPRFTLDAAGVVATASTTAPVTDATIPLPAAGSGGAGAAADVPPAGEKLAAGEGKPKKDAKAAKAEAKEAKVAKAMAKAAGATTAAAGAGAPAAEPKKVRVFATSTCVIRVV
jgi:hypothetical protein